MLCIVPQHIWWKIIAPHIRETIFGSSLCLNVTLMWRSGPELLLNWRGRRSRSLTMMVRNNGCLQRGGSSPCIPPRLEAWRTWLVLVISMRLEYFAIFSSDTTATRFMWDGLLNLVKSCKFYIFRPTRDLFLLQWIPIKFFQFTILNK